MKMPLCFFIYCCDFHCFINIPTLLPFTMQTKFFTGCPETLALNMSKLVWSVSTTVKQRDPLASEVSNLFLSSISLFVPY